ncbi:MAG: hypothetical protein JW894_01410 [Bacteroidales bacterium]|nr:hypothetical protein [Bacteroidales bacterium]
MRYLKFISAVLISFILYNCNPEKDKNFIMTVKGPITAKDMGISLIHEHVMVDFIGADSTGKHRWNNNEVFEVVLPYLKEFVEAGGKTLIECTPSYLGKDPELLKSLSDASGLNIVTNTGYYGAFDNKYLPPHAFTETAEELAQRWISEWENGIEGTGIKPGFIKISVDPGNLSDLHKKIVVAAAKTHLATGLTIASHTGPAVPALEQLDVLKKQGVSPDAFIWVHAQAEKDLSKHIEAAKQGAWISLDGVSDNNIENYIKMISNLRDHDLLNRTLISHDAGWYTVGEEGGGDFRGYNTIYKKLVPALLENGFNETDIATLLVKNPAEAFSVKLRPLNK